MNRDQVAEDRFRVLQAEQLERPFGVAAFQITLLVSDTENETMLDAGRLGAAEDAFNSLVRGAGQSVLLDSARASMCGRSVALFADFCC